MQLVTSSFAMNESRSTFGRSAFEKAYSIRIRFMGRPTFIDEGRLSRQNSPDHVIAKHDIRCFADAGRRLCNVDHAAACSMHETIGGSERLLDRHECHSDPTCRSVTTAPSRSKEIIRTVVKVEEEGDMTQ